MSTVPNLALKALEIVSASKKNFIFVIRKIWSLLKIKIVVLLDKKLRELIAIFYMSIFIDKKYKVMLHFVVRQENYCNILAILVIPFFLTQAVRNSF